jgi:uncharacterized membrane protein
MNFNVREWLVFGLVVLIVLIGGLAFLSLFGGSGDGSMMGGQRMMGPGLMGFGGGIISCLLWPLVLGLLIGLIVWIVQATNSNKPETQQTEETCPDCKRPVQSDWQVCPHCGAALSREVK